MDRPSVAARSTVTADGRLLHADDAMAALLGVGRDDLAGRKLHRFGADPADSTDVLECLRACADGAAGHVRVTLRTDDDRELHIQLVAAPSGEHIEVLVLDETDRVLAERELASSQRRWLALARNAADIVFTVEADGKLTTVTSALPQHLGWAVEDVVGRRGLSFVHPDDRPAADAAWIAVSSGRSSQERLDARLVHADRTVTWARLVISDLRDDPDVGAVVGNVTDITAQKDAEARRLDEEARFRARFEQSRLPQTMQSIEGAFEAVNDAFCALVGRTRADLIGNYPRSVIHPDDDAADELAVTYMIAQHIDSTQVERVLQDAEGNPVAVRIDVTLLRDADGEPSGCASTLQDLRPLRDSERARVELQRFFDVVAERSRDFVTLHDADGSTLYASPAGFAMFGRGYDKSSDVQSLAVHPDDLAPAAAGWAYVQTHGESHTWRYRAQDADGEWLWIEQTSTNLLDTDVGGIVSNIRDVTAEVAVADALRTSEARYRAMAETAEEGIIVVSPEGDVTYANARLAAMLGVPAEHMIGAQAWRLLDTGGRSTIDQRARVRGLRAPERYELPYLHPDGTRRVLWVAASPMPEVDGRPQGSLAMISDITEMRRSADELRQAAQHDDLTGLLNRTMLMRHLESLSLPDQDGIAVLFVDLDHFKDVNDGRGHTAGDGVLIEVAERLIAIAGPNDLVARFGGDEFVVVLHGVDAQAAGAVASSVLATLSKTYSIGHHTIRLGATIGIAVSPASSAEDLLRFADTAMYAAKAAGRGRVRLFDRPLAEQAEERYVLGAELLTALADDGLEMYYQPVVDVSTGEVVGVEALARWHHPTRGEIMPAQFVAIAELNASSSDLDRWVIKRVLRDVAELKADLTMPDDAYVAINLSGQSLSDEGLYTYIVDCVAEAGIDPGVITLEITESAIMDDRVAAAVVLQRLRDRGFQIAIDDFGTGYSSMVYLRDLPVTVLKIDRGFIRGIPDDPHSLAIVTSLIELARSLDFTVVAEGVETHAHLDALRARGCGLGQGWLWSPALSVDQLRSTRILTDRFEATDVEPDLR